MKFSQIYIPLPDNSWSDQVKYMFHPLGEWQHFWRKHSALERIRALGQENLG